jgi:hypothetical protein
LQNILKNYGTEISEEKTKSMAVTRKTPQRVKILINNKIIEQRMDFIYLGSHISPFEHQKDIERNFRKYNKLNGVLRRNFGKELRKDLQIRFHNVITKPALLYGSECWTLRQKNRNKIKISQMKFGRSFTGVNLRDRIKSEDLRNRWRVYEMVQEVQNYQFKRMQHVLRMPANRLPRKLLSTNLMIAEVWGDHIADGQISSRSRRTGNVPKLPMGRRRRRL